MPSASFDGSQKSGFLRSSVQPLSSTKLLEANLSIATRAHASHARLTKPGFELSMFSDSGVIGDAKTMQERVTLVGKTSARATVSLVSQGKRLRTIADPDGSFLFSDIPLKLGKNILEAIAQDSSQSQVTSASFKLTLRRVGNQTIDPVIVWNAVALKAALLDGTPAPAIARNLAVVHTAVYDAVNAIERQDQTYHLGIVPVGASAAAAAVGAAHTALISLYPKQKTTFDAALSDSLALIPDGLSETEGVNFGKMVADAIVISRQSDGASTLGASADRTYRPGKAAGEWRPTPPNFRDAFLPYWGNVLPFAVTSSTQFRPVQPPNLKSRKYARELQQVKRLGALDSPNRTDEQTTIAQFWSSIGGPVYWNQLAEQLADRQQGSLLENARLFARLNLAEADAGITAWNTKYTYSRWRPIDAIRRADGSLLKERDRQWTPLLNTPSHPDYISAHSIFSNAAAVILARSFHQPIKFTTTSSSLPGVRRTYKNFEAAAQEAGISRIYGGIHTATANRTGLQLGRALGNYVFNFL